MNSEERTSQMLGRFLQDEIESDPGEQTKFTHALKAVVDAVDNDHITRLEIARLQKAHRDDLEQLKDDNAKLQEAIRDLIENLDLFREMEKEFRALKEEIHGVIELDKQNLYFVGLSMGIISEMFREADLKDQPHCLADLVL